MTQAGFVQLDQMIAKLRQLPELGRRAAPDVATVIREELERTVAAGTTSFGVPWKPRQLDGSKPLQGALKSLFVNVSGPTVYMRLDGIERRHHFGQVKGGVARNVIPKRGDPIPSRWVERITDVVQRHFDELMSAAGDNG